MSADISPPQSSVRKDQHFSFNAVLLKISLTFLFKFKALLEIGTFYFLKFGKKLTVFYGLWS